MKGLKRLILEELRSVSELVKPEEINLSSFIMHENLNSDIWDSDKKINSKVRKKLLKIADDFIEFLDVPWLEIKDVILTGSLANYNWSKFSDIDLHVIINYDDIDDNEELVRDYLNSKRKLWNDTHNIYMYNFEIEIYAQNEQELHHSTGIYSLEDNKWITKPSQIKPKIDATLIKRKASELMSKIDDIVELSENEEYDGVIKEYEKLWDKIKKIRKTGLEREGEFSYENLIFKVLRRSGYIEKFIKIKTDAYDTLHSI